MALDQVPYPHTDHLLQRAARRIMRNDGEFDHAQYLLLPGVNFRRPYLAIPGGRAYVWPLPVDGFSIRSTPQLALHKYIGSNQVEVDVVHRGERHLTLTGVFPGSNSAANMLELSDIVERETPEGGKILYLPGLFTRSQFVYVEDFSCDHQQGTFDADITYSISFTRTGVGDKIPDAKLRLPVEIPLETVTPRGKGTRVVYVAGSRNTLRNIARWVYSNGSRWVDLYNENMSFFTKHKIQKAKAPDYRLPAGLAIRY